MLAIHDSNTYLPTSSSSSNVSRFTITLCLHINVNIPLDWFLLIYVTRIKKKKKITFNKMYRNQNIIILFHVTSLSIDKLCANAWKMFFRIYEGLIEVFIPYFGQNGVVDDATHGNPPQSVVRKYAVVCGCSVDFSTLKI